MISYYPHGDTLNYDSSYDSFFLAGKRVRLAFRRPVSISLLKLALFPCPMVATYTRLTALEYNYNEHCVIACLQYIEKTMFAIRYQCHLGKRCK